MYLSEMPKYRLQINGCQLQLRQVPDSKVFTSYAGGLEVRLVLNSEVKVLGGQTQHQKQFVRNLFRDDEIKTLMLKC